jgi:glutaredoxin
VPNITAIVYGSQDCRPCKVATEWLEKKGIQVIRKDPSELHGQFYSLPVTKIGNRTITGFNPGLFELAIRSVGP